MLKLHQLILTFFYFGKFPKAPGTMGSLAALIFWFFTNRYFYYSDISFATQNLYWTIFLTAIFLYGCFFIRTYTKQFRQIDHQTIVLDVEIVKNMKEAKAWFKRMKVEQPWMPRS